MIILTSNVKTTDINDINTHPAEATIRQPSVYPDISPSPDLHRIPQVARAMLQDICQALMKTGKNYPSEHLHMVWSGRSLLLQFSPILVEYFCPDHLQPFFFLSGYTLGVQTFFAFFSGCQYLKYFKPWQKYDTLPLNYYLYCNLLLLVLTQCLHDSFPELSNCLKPRELDLKEDITYSFHISYCWQNLVVYKYVYTLIHIVHNSMNNKSTNTIKV